MINWNFQLIIEEMKKGLKENKKSNKRKKYKWKILIFLCSNFLIRIESFLQDLAKLLMQNDQLKKRVDTTIRLLNQLRKIILLLLINNHSGIKGTELWMNPLKEFTPNKFLYDFCKEMYEVVCSKIKEQVFIHIFLLITKTFFFFYLESNSTYFFRIFFKK
ncbi:hypothetical protein ACJX0J_004611 [Zea mays]